MIKIRYILGIIALLLSALTVMGQQKDIARIVSMPDKPAPYKAFDWKKTATDYDKLVFDISATGDHLPITTISGNEGINYSDVRNIRMSTFVGHNDKNAAEAINILPAIVGASLVGVDKSNQNNINWVEKTKDFFNLKNGQNVYLNNYSAGTGNDWWYELMPNVYFYQLYDLYPNGATEFKEQFAKVADRQLDVVYKLGGTVSPWQHPDMNYRAFNLETGKGNAEGVKQPEAAGSIGWILYQAYLKSGDEKYRLGAELSLDFLQNFGSNPSYEIQLPYGILTAARLNAEENADYDIDKFMNWAFSDGKNTLRQWGTIVGNWNGYDMSGLIGEAKDGGDDYAFLMNGFQHAAALTPAAKYDKRYAKAIAKWILNLSNASRFFYPEALPDANKEAESLKWSRKYDTAGAIPYESIKENWNGTKPYAMGDALKGGWAATNLSLYSGAGVGYLAAIVEPTNIEGILQINLNKTDFGAANELENYLYYNPNSGAETVTVNLPTGQYNIYDAITETNLFTDANGSVQLNIPSKEVRLLVIYPAAKTTQENGRLLVLNSGEVLDYHHKWNYTPALRIKSLYAAKNEIMTGDKLQIDVLAANAEGITYEWYVNGTKIDGNKKSLEWTAPEKEGVYTIKSVVNAAGKTASEQIDIQVLSASSVAPEIKSVNFSGSNPYKIATAITITAEANVSDGIEWTCTGGTIENANTLTPKWTLPNAEGIYTIQLTLTNLRGTASQSYQVLVKDTDKELEYNPVVYYPMDGDTKNAAQDNLHGVLVGDATLVKDAQDEPNRAYSFANSDQYIYTANSGDLNFQDQLTLSFWVKPAKVGEGEQFVISHGSWEERYKASLTPDKKLRFTIKTTDRIVDIDDPTPLENDVYVHYTCVFTGSSVEIYRNGNLASFTALGGKIAKSTKHFTIARKDENTADYSFKGAIDEVRLYDVALDVAAIKELPSIFADVASNSVEIKNLLINGLKWEDINDIYTVDCSNTSETLTVEVETYSGSKVDKRSVSVDITKPSIQPIQFTIATDDDVTSKQYTLFIETPFQSKDIVTQKWNKVLTINNNSLTNGGFNFTAYKWYKNNVPIGQKQYYSAGNGANDILDSGASYTATMVTDAEQEMRVCPFSIQEQQTSGVSVYPNPVNVGESICLEANVEQKILETATADIYTLSGLYVRSMKLQEVKSYFELNKSGLYILKYTAADGMQQSFKILVK